MAKDTTKRKGKTAKSRSRKHPAGPNGDAGGVALKRDTTVNLGDELPDPPSDFVLLEDDDWIEDK